MRRACPFGGSPRKGRQHHLSWLPSRSWGKPRQMRTRAPNYQIPSRPVSPRSFSMSALPPKADIADAMGNVRFVPKADIAALYSITSSSLGCGAYQGEIAAKYPIEPQPSRQLFCKLLVALDRHRTAYQIAPIRLAEVDRDEITNNTTAYEIDGETWVFHAYVHIP